MQLLSLMMTISATRSAPDSRWIPELDGWRAVSILLVLAGHLLPIGPKEWQLNAAAATAGMGLFFILSGFLITSFLLNRPDPGAFLIRRGARILPLAWAYIGVALALQGGVATDVVLRHVFFLGNLPPFGLLATTAHFWSLCAEVHFYLAAALLVAILGRRGLLLLPLAALAITGLRIASETHLSIVTWLRVDEILAGACLALLYHHGLLRRPEGRTAAWTLAAVLLIYFAAAHPLTGALNYLRPYLAACAVALSLGAGGVVHRLLRTRPLAHVALISYALYVWHPLLADTWLGSGDGVVKYLKRPLLFATLWAVAYVSTTYYEAFWMRVGRRWERRVSARGALPVTQLSDG